MKNLILLFFSALAWGCCETPKHEISLRPSEYVTTLVGTQSDYSLSTGNTYPAVALPWGMNFWTPQTGKMGEVWEDASNKTAYGKRRRYFTNAELDSVMNYPFRTAIINFMRGFDSGYGLKETVMSIVENYPQQVMHCNMNLLGTHDTPRILTALVDDFDGPRAEKARRRLSRNQWDVAYDRLLMAFVECTFPDNGHG